MTSKRFTDEFKAEAVKQVSERGYPSPRWPSASACHRTVSMCGFVSAASAAMRVKRRRMLT